ncbi:hypothetical protein EYF80_001885 [Liparis tanakae]|uniref:Uncharacterized protein n=1 Tax=Liparis tanakae TaxID=230148 RepID=A0A4Z2JD31_9TELE|nr:hypothetical protein EYF80_001885 [Liparis tanakae]
MLSNTSGSTSSAEGRLRMVTFLGTGCSGSGSFFPALGTQRNHNTIKDTVGLYCPYYCNPPQKPELNPFSGLAPSRYDSSLLLQGLRPLQNKLREEWRGKEKERRVLKGRKEGQRTYMYHMLVQNGFIDP